MNNFGLWKRLLHKKDEEKEMGGQNDSKTD